MYSVDVLFNDKTSVEFFGSMTTVDEIVSGIVSRRFSEKCELDLSNFCDDPGKSSFQNKSLMSKISTETHLFQVLLFIISGF